MGSTGKHYKDAITRYDRNQAYSGSEALELAASLAGAKFNEGIDLVVRLGVDPRKAEEMIRGTVALPAGTGRDVRVAVFAQGEAAAAARKCCFPMVFTSLTGEPRTSNRGPSWD